MLSPKVQGNYLVKPVPRAFMDTQTWIDALAVCGYAGGLTPPSEIQFYLQLDVPRRSNDEIIYRFTGMPEIPWQEVQGTYVESNAVDAPKLGKDIERRFGCLRLERDDTTVTVAGAEPNTVEVISLEEYGRRMEMANAYFRSYNTWCHSHVKMTATPSGTDNTQWEEWKSAFADAPICAMLIFNLDGQLFVRIRDAVIGRELEAIPVQLLDPDFSEGLTEACKARVRPKVTAYSSTAYQYYGANKSSGSSASSSTAAKSQSSTKTALSTSVPAEYVAYRKLFDTFRTYPPYKPTFSVGAELALASRCIDAIDEVVATIEDFQFSSKIQKFSDAALAYTSLDLRTRCEWRQPLLNLYKKMLSAQGFKERVDSLYQTFSCLYEAFYDDTLARKMTTEKEMYDHIASQEYSYTRNTASPEELHRDQVFLHFLNFTYLFGSFLLRKDTASKQEETLALIKDLKRVLSGVLTVEYATAISEVMEKHPPIRHPARESFVSHLNDLNVTTHPFTVYFYAIHAAAFMVSSDAVSNKILADTVEIFVDALANDVFRLTYILKSDSDSVPSGGSVQKTLETSPAPTLESKSSDDDRELIFVGWDEFQEGLA